MLMTIGKPKDKGKVDAGAVMLDLVDRSDEVVVGMTDRVVKARIVYRVPRSTGNELWQHTSAEIAEGELVNAACVASVRSTVKVMELREDKVRWFCIKAKFGFSKDCEGCRVAASGDKVSRPRGKECRERIRVVVMCDDAGQQRLRAAEERLAPAASAARAETAQEGQASLARVEFAQESRGGQLNGGRYHASWRTTGIGRGPSRDRGSEEGGRNAGACRRVGNVHQRDDTDPYVAWCDYSELQSGRIVLQKQIW